jgi:hypothetical protein
VWLSNQQTEKFITKDRHGVRFPERVVHAEQGQTGADQKDAQSRVMLKQMLI